MLDAFKVKPYDLEPVYACWADGPVFIGNPKKDPPVQEWLEQIRQGCVERKVPEEYWYKVAQHFMGDKARNRVRELRMVLDRMHGGKYRWTWKKFKLAMDNMGWDIDITATEEIKVQAKTSGGSWWVLRKNNQKVTPEAPSRKSSESDLKRPAHIKASSDTSVMTWRAKPKRSNTDSIVSSEQPRSQTAIQEPPKKPPIPMRSKTLEFFARPRSHSRSNSEEVVLAKDAVRTAEPESTIITSETADTITHAAQAPVWLLNACNALDFLTSEHPKAMSAISAVLITVGTIPAIPAVSAGAGGALLASGAVQAAGAIAVSVGSWIKAQQESKGRIQAPGASGSVEDAANSPHRAITAP